MCSSKVLSSQLLVRKDKFVPKCKSVTDFEAKALECFIRESKHLIAITGAGLSTESGIPDYRSEKVGLFERTKRKPVQYQEFLKSDHIRRRYWARSFLAWPHILYTSPNYNHYMLSLLENKGYLKHIITQNVDILHTKAGSKNVIELHGCLNRIKCLSCGDQKSRYEFQQELSILNFNWIHKLTEFNFLAPDGDVELEDDKVLAFKVPGCKECKGILKPDVVFFGDNVPSDVVNKSNEILNKSDSVLVLGSSLQVYSGYKYVLRSYEENKKICIVNIGPTRADHLATLKITAKCSDVFKKIY